ncbi:MAG: succinylglutamate desuccinylase/aspartoacylase family protein [Oscillospiraceae bacterium]|nr:succinylglutamate desuccinylase/aspartoacylase family protein [Oscillospiraceae bacterium]
MNPKERIWIQVEHSESAIPLTAITGAKDGKTVLVTAGVHSRECVGIEAARLLAERLNPQTLRGRVLIAHACNYAGFLGHSDDIVPGDGKNLNKCFPGDRAGSESEKIAACITEKLVMQSDCLIDLHSGGGHEYLVPHAYYQRTADRTVVETSIAMAAHANMNYNVGAAGTDGLYSSAALLGKPSVLIERGQCGLWSETECEQAVADAKNILRYLGILCDGVEPIEYEQAVTERAFYEKAPVTGCWYPGKKPGARIAAGEKIGEIRDIYGEPLAEIIAKVSGVVLYETSAFAIRQDEPMIAYGEL